MSNQDWVAGFAPSVITIPPSPPITPPPQRPAIYISPGKINQFLMVPGMIIYPPLNATIYVWVTSAGQILIGSGSFPVQVYPIAIVNCTLYGVITIQDVRPQGAFSFGTASNLVGPGLPGVVPGGPIDGSNTTFTLPSLPTAGGLFLAFRNGQYQIVGVDYTIAGTVITWLYPPSPGDDIVIFYS